jgi:hypothetical protein
VSRKKIRVYESAYLSKLDQRADVDGDVKHAFQEIKDEFDSDEREKTTDDKRLPLSSGEMLKPELDKNMVQSIKSLREHRFLTPGSRREARGETKLERAASVVNDQFGGEGDDIDNICNQQEFGRLTKLLQDATESATSGISKPSIRSQVLAKLKSVNDLVSNNVMEKGRLKVGKRKGKADVSGENVVKGKRVKPTIPALPETQGSSSEPPIQLSPKKQMIGVKPTQIKTGDVVSLPSAAFDGDQPGSFFR